jgi:hypothetical protein
LVAVAASDLNACGDKMLLLGRAVQFSRVQTQKNPLSIILYKHTGLAKESGMNDFEIVMKRIGHKVRIAKDLMQLNEALSSGPVNYVAADPTDVPTVQRTAGAAPSKPRVISMDVPAKAKTDQYVALLPETITNK